MRRARHPGLTPWFMASLLADMTEDELAALEPRDATLQGFSDKSNVMKTARIEYPRGTFVSASARKAADALRQALAKLEVRA